MGKHHEKIAEALRIRQANWKDAAGKKPGSMNKKKTGYAKPKNRGNR